jgi:hypothetical protein
MMMLEVDFDAFWTVGHTRDWLISLLGRQVRSLRDKPIGDAVRCALAGGVVRYGARSGVARGYWATRALRLSGAAETHPKPSENTEETPRPQRRGGERTRPSATDVPLTLGA